MVKNFKDTFGLPADRVKLESGIGDFEIVKIEFRETKKKYSVINQDTNVASKLTLPIAYFDAKFENGEVKKYFSMSKPIIQAIIDIAKDAGILPKSAEKVDKEFLNKSYTLKESIFVASVESAASESNPNNPYLYFT